MARKKTTKKAATAPRYEAFEHPEAQSPMRPDVGTQAAFKKKKPPVTYRYDSSLAPSLEWDGQNPAREQGEAQIARIEELSRRLTQLDPERDQAEYQRIVADLRDAAARLKARSRPFLNWAGKAERLSFDVPTLPLFVHERLSTRGIIETLGGHKKDTLTQGTMFDLFGDPQHSIADQLTRAYEFKDGWVNRMILGDSLVVMNSLLHFENLGGQVQMIYMDPPYGVQFGSNFQPFVRRRDVKHNDDTDLTREPEMVQAYRDTWELGIHSYLTYLRDRLIAARELLSPTGSVFLQMGDENVHLARSVLDEVFGKENCCSLISYVKTTTTTGRLLPNTADYILWYAKDIERVKFRQLFDEKVVGGEAAGNYTLVELPDGSRRPMNREERENPEKLSIGSRPYRIDNLTSPRIREARTGYFPIEFNGRKYLPLKGEWKTNAEGIERLRAARRLAATGNGLYYVRYIDDFPAFPLNNSWADTVVAGFASDKLYVVETNPKAIRRCMLMTTDPGDLVLDPTCGSGTTAYVAEQWGRRWITIDTSRVPLALARQRLLTATFSYYQLADERRGPAGGFVYKRKQNNRGEEVGGIVPHVTLKSIANNEPPAEEVLVDRPEVESGITRVTGPFSVEGTIPPPVEMRDQPVGTVDADATFADRMLEVLRKSPVLRLDGNRSVTLKNVRPPAKSLTISAEAIQSGEEERPVAFVFGPENGAISETLVSQAIREAHMKGYAHLYAIGFAIQPNARNLVEIAAEHYDLPATYVQATPDLLMGDLLKNLRSSQIFSVCGLPEVAVRPAGDGRYEVELIGLDVFDPITMEVNNRRGDDVPAWFLDTNYNGLCFHVCQAFFPRTSAWDNLKKALKGTYDDAVWDHLAGTTSTPFEPGEHRQVAVKVIDDRGNELLVVKPLA